METNPQATTDVQPESAPVSPAPVVSPDPVAPLAPEHPKTVTLTEESLKQIVAEAVQKESDERKREDEANARLQQRRQAFIQDKMRNFPKRFQEAIGNDPDKWDAESLELEKEFREMMDAMVASGHIYYVGVSGSPPSGSGKTTDFTPAITSGVQAIAEGLKKRAVRRAPGGGTYTTNY